MDNSRLEKLHALAFDLVTSKTWMALLAHPDELAALLACMQAMVVDGCRHLPVTNHEELIRQLLEYTESNRLMNLQESN